MNTKSLLNLAKIAACVGFTLIPAVFTHAQTYPFVFEYVWVGSPEWGGTIWLDAPASDNGSITNMSPDSYFWTPYGGGPVIQYPPWSKLRSWNSERILDMSCPVMYPDHFWWSAGSAALFCGWDGFGTNWTLVDPGAWLSVTTKPITITQHPTNFTVEAHGTASFVVSGGNSLVWRYQWALNGTNLGGATSSRLTLTNVTPAHLGLYSAVLSNTVGAVTSSNAVLAMYPHIEKPFRGLMAYWGKDAALGVEAWGTGPLSYQWFKDGSEIPGGTAETLSLPSIQFTNAGLYSVVVSSTLGRATNAPAQVVVNPAGVSFGMYPGVTVNGVVGYTYAIQASAGLADTNTWTTVATLTLTQPEQLWIDTFTDAASVTNRQRFYRVVPAP